MMDFTLGKNWSILTITYSLPYDLAYLKALRFGVRPLRWR
jgi:hypothetical protein